MIGLIFPNLLWAKHQPIGYDTSHENKVLLVLERVGEVLTSCFGVISFQEVVYCFDIFMMISIVAMFIYEGFWVRYFKSAQTLNNFYASFLGIPLAGATCPVIAFLCL
ncbi:hypothetical protein [Candidatus Stoquefichus massiliensis]|uniref:hypothetical protein n=1 Tax=Candidatus Stoquefichus massiliensis TaxID=1470350 RepID=UPI0004B506C8|nr:hypothetical protein [Candidatus Stoquefichus massiliensis]